LRVLVVEGWTLVGQALAERLSRERDIEVIGVESSSAGALATLVTGEPDIVTTCYSLPDGDGIQLTRQIKAIMPGVAVVMVSRFGGEGVLVAAMEAGASGFVAKSAPLDSLVLAVRAAAAGEALISPGLLNNGLPTAHRGRGGRSASLTPRESEVLRLFSEGLTDKAIAERLGVAEKTVRNHVESVLEKLESHSKLEALATAIRRRIIVLD
jgi:DNA-binding NarL/FixJ family response regulator